MASNSDIKGVTRHGSRRRVVVTGIGAITPIGTGKEGLWNGVRRGRSAVRRITRFDPSEFKSQVAGEVDFDPNDFLDPRQARRYDRFSQLGVAAALSAMADAGLARGSTVAERSGVYLGSALGGLSFAEEQHVNYMERGIRAVDPILALTVFGSAASCNVAMQLGLNGPNSTNANSCASGAIAIGHATELIRRGGVDVMLAGGVEAPLAPLTFGAFDLIRALATANNETPDRASRPFDRLRDGFVMAEGAAVLVLEELEHARARGAEILMEIKGFATTTDAHHMTAPLPGGAQSQRSMREALADAGIGPEDIDYISAHGSATPLNDKTETASVRAVFGEYADRIPISGTKGMHGHALGASGAFEAAICALCISRGWLPPAINNENRDPECDLNLIGGDGLEKRVDYVLKNSFGFGGINATLVFSRFRGA